MMLISSIAHATVFALLGSLVYLALRRWSPASGAFAASASIAIMTLVFLIVLGPWPRWWVLAANEPGNAQATLSSARHTDRNQPLAGATESRPSAIAGAEKTQTSAIARDESSAIGATVARFLKAMSDEVDSTASAGPARRSWSVPGWIAAGFLLSLSIGLTRLGLGVLAVIRLRNRSLPISDAALSDEVDLLRAELCCPKKVEVRETTELPTPATIGCRRPLLLLPCEWRDWSLAERRVVLTHELAHVCRGDYLAGLAAHLSLALHFYHPVAHWLTARLRLEQELAADAWGAELSGGKTSYLETLARMALKRDTQPLSWPARAFLPSRGTFVRRIEMLRNTHQIRNLSLTALARAGTIAILAALGLLVAGLRGPDGPTTAHAQVTSQSAAGIAGPGAPGPTAGTAYNLAFLPADAKMVVAARPAILLQYREVREMLSQFTQHPSQKALRNLHLDQAEELLVFWDGIPEPPGLTPILAPPSGVVLHMSNPQDWKASLVPLLGSVEEVRVAGQSYHRPDRSGPGSWCAYAPDDRTLVLARQDLLRELIEDRKAPAPPRAWDEPWKKVARGQLMLALETRWLRRRLAQAWHTASPTSIHTLAPGLTLEMIAPLLEKSQAYAISIDASQGLSADAVAATGADENSKPVLDTIQAVLTLFKNAVGGLRRDPPSRRNSEAMDWTFQAAESLLGQARLDTSPGFVHLHADSPVRLAEGIKLLAPEITAARDTVRRTTSMNNLKQIGLAFHNYHDVNGRFPAPVLYGSKDHSIPYSWRVAILPFLEQNDLYQQYHFDEPWDGPNNRKLLEQMPGVYSYPGPDGRSPSSRTISSYYVFSGSAAALGSAVRSEQAADGPGVAQITDGTSNTILAVEWQGDIPWTKPLDIPFDPNGPRVELGGYQPDGFNALFADGSVRFLSKSIAAPVLKALITRSGGEVIRATDF
jgi:prepilin-type processing-associated H-X9-DG protein